LGNDALTGDLGNDSFVFSTAPNAKTNLDKITDFNVTDDSILLDSTVFSALTNGVLTASQFRSGKGITNAADADDHLIYNSSTGALYYDEDGIGGNAAVQLAKLAPKLNLTAADFVVNAPDTTSPVFASATVSGSILVITYTEANTLEATNVPATTAFTVSDHAVTGVSVDAAAKTVTLTLGSAVVNGETVTVGYTDPTTGNDTAAIQDATGNDVATITAQAVTNNTPAPVLVKSLAYSATTFVEAVANDGSITATSTITLTNETFTGSDGQVLTGAVVTNVPTGLTAVVTRTSATTATVAFTGNATAHANANDIGNLTVILGNAAFTGGSAAAVTSATTSNLVVDFADDITPVVTQLLAGSTLPVTATSQADIFGFTPSAAKALSAYTQIPLRQFDVAHDQLQFDLTAVLGVTTLAALNGVEGISVTPNVITNSTTINFGLDVNGDVVILTLVGITSPSDVSVNVV
jgi:hypothetical protein